MPNNKQCLPREQMAYRKRVALWWWLYHRARWSYAMIGYVFAVDRTTVMDGVKAAREIYADEIVLLELAGRGEKLITLIDKLIAKE